LANVYARLGRVADARQELSVMYEKARRGFVPAMDFAIAYAGLHNKDSTFAWLEKAVLDHSMRPYVFDPTFDLIRSDPRYQQLMRQMHLPYGGVAVMQSPRPDPPHHRRPANQRAEYYFNEGTGWFDKRTPKDAAKAESSFKLAIASDSTFADPHAGLAQTYISYAIGNFGDYEPKKYLLAARREAQRALTLDSTVAEAHAAQGNVLMFYDLDWAGAERELNRSLQLDPRSVNGRAFRSVLLEYTQRFAEAVAEAREDVRLQPWTEQAWIELGRALLFDGRYDDAAELLKRSIERDSSRFRAHLLLGEVLVQQAKYDSAVSEMQAAVRYADNSSRARAYLANVYARARRTADAQQELAAMYKKARTVVVPSFDFAIVYVGMGNKDSTFAWLERALADHSMRPYLFDPTFDSIRSDPRYAQLLHEMHLPYRPAAR
jgi:tetratricopeptide (TPR) repeat protein